MKIENCKLKIIRRASGFTLIELLIVISITAILAGATLFGPGLFGFKQDRDLSLSADGIVATLRTAQTKAASQEGGTAWGVRFVNPASGLHYYQLFSGSSYSPANVVGHSLLSGATTFTLPTGSSTMDVIFSAATGRPTNTAAIALSAAVRPNVATVFVNSGGAITSVADRGLVGYWPLDEGVGTSTHDGSGNGNTATLTNNPTWATGKVGGALSLVSTSNQYARRSSGIGLPTGSSPRTFMAWIRPSGYSTDPNHTGIFGYGGMACTGLGSLLSIRNDGRPTMAFWCNDAYQTIGSAAVLNEWNHIAFTYAGGTTVGFYVNGQFIQESSLTAGIPAATVDGPIRIGCTDDPGRCFNGLIDEVRIYNRALSASEIKAIFEATR